MKSVQIGKRIIGEQYKPYFIADIAANHDGDISRAYKLIELAKEAGADAAKFQNFRAKTIVSRNGFELLSTQKSHQKEWKKSVYDVYEDATVPDEWTMLLKEKCDEVGIEYMTSPYDINAVDCVEPFVNCYKIGSGDITWLEIIEHIAKKGKVTILATGASILLDVKRAYDVIEKQNKEIVLMQCNTNYTASNENFKNINLNVLNTYKKEFPNAVLGLSDHTKGHTTVIGAIALGARVIEKHFTDDNLRVGPDHKFSMTPSEWSEMVKAGNEVFLALGDGIKKVEENEQETLYIQRRGLYTTNKLTSGHIITKEDIFPLRPMSLNGFTPYQANELIGKRVINDIEADRAISMEDVDK